MTPKLHNMTEAEARDCVAFIKENRDCMTKAIVEFHSREGWRAIGYKSWKECCEKEFGYSRQYAYMLIKTSEINSQVSTMVDTVPKNPNELPPELNERQARALISVPEEDRPQVLEIAKSAGPITAKAIEIAKQKLEEARPTVIVAPPPPKFFDKEGTPLPPEVVERWKSAELDHKTLTRLISEVRSMFRIAMDKKNPVWNEIKWQDNFALIEKLLSNIRLISPHGLCTSCGGLRVEKCTLCRHRGFMSDFMFKFHANDQVKAIRAKARQA